MAVIASPNTSIPDGLKVNIPHSSMLPFLFLNFFKKNYLFIYFWLQLLSLRAATTEACVPRAHAPQQEKPSQ